ncbi:MAG: hypothetical protein ABIQ90_02370 [Polaromonas sp.]
MKLFVSSDYLVHMIALSNNLPGKRPANTRDGDFKVRRMHGTISTLPTIGRFGAIESIASCARRVCASALICLKKCNFRVFVFAYLALTERQTEQEGNDPIPLETRLT